jgi:hypothetical protein
MDSELYARKDFKLIKADVLLDDNYHTERFIERAHQYFAYRSDDVTCPYALRFLDCLPTGERYIVDSRVHMLMPGWYPCIPGWHFDEIKRTEDNKLDFEHNDFRKVHYLMIIDSGSESLTEFAWPELRRYPESYEELNEIINNDFSCKKETVKANAIYRFSCMDAHRGMPAKRFGWRYFIRATVHTEREYKSKIRTQTQVYTPSPKIDAGW